MTKWEFKLKDADRVLRTLAPKMRELRTQLAILEYVYTFNAKLKFECERHIVPIKILSPKASNKKPEQKADMIIRKAKALSSEDRKELLKALEGTK